jgi:hypothetical protein
MRRSATVAENHHLRLCAARNLQKPHRGDSSKSRIPHEMNELGLRLFRVYGTALACKLGTRIYPPSANAGFFLACGF